MGSSSLIGMLFDGQKLQRFRIVGVSRQGVYLRHTIFIEDVDNCTGADVKDL